jgi:hypothetical protein|tara:strand:+ start:537 stop:803 length:267 start_codon:yes stop_codon:yes gene_type:complete
MSSLKRKIKRKAAANKRKQMKRDVSEKMGLFNKIPESCSACDKPFDKKDKEMVMSWNVVVREEEAIVRLYCPECWSKAKEFIKEYTNK